MSDALAALKEKMAVINGLRHAGTLMSWDQETYMPSGGAPGRARAMATVSRLAHEMATSSEYGALLERAEAQGDDLDPDSDDARLLARARRDFDRAVRLPSDFVAELRQATSLSTQVWQAARKANDFDRFAPHLEKVIGLQRQKAEYYGYSEHPYDALLDLFEPDMKTSEVRPIFAELREQTVPLVRAIAERGDVVDDRFLHQPFDEGTQWKLASELAAFFGYDFDHGRMDRSAHPFCTTLAQDDVRMTLRVDPSFFNPLFFATAHETGHALYNQGYPAHFEGTSLLGGASSAIHESQSRQWENLVGRSRAFWTSFLPRAQAAFPDQLGGVDAEAMYRAVNRSRPSLNRVEADEVTYNMHIMLRFDIELAMMEERVTVNELPALWNDKMEEYLGIRPETDAEGIMQDIHWSQGLYGYFPTYTLGNVVSVQLFNAAKDANPDLTQQIESGNIQPLLGWMRENIHQHGRKYLPQDLLERATGHRLTAQPYLAYLKEKFGEIYGITTGN